MSKQKDAEILLTLLLLIVMIVVGSYFSVLFIADYLAKLQVGL